MVVVAGVLVAQAAANYVQDRSSEKHMENARATTRGQVAAASFVALGWQRAANCIDERMEQIMRSTARGDEIDPAQLERPAMRTARVMMPDDQSMLLLARRHGDAEAIALRRASGNIENLLANIEDITTAWEGLILVDPRYGPVGEADRVQARLAAARIKARLTGVRINAANVVDSSQRIGLPANSNGLRLLRNCDDLWRTGKTVPSTNE